MIQRIRRGNDFRHTWPITWNGQPEDFSDATDVTLTAKVYGQVKTLTEGVDYHIDGGNVVVDFTPTICDITGTYTVELNYIKPSAEFTDGDRRSAVDVRAFQIVNTSAESNATEGVSLPSEALAIYALKYEDLSPENIAELQRPATEAAESIGELERTIEGNEADRIEAEGLRQTNTLTAIQNANTAADNANEMSSHPPVIINDYWHNWNFTTNQYETTGQYARGDSAIEGSLVLQTTGQSAVDVMSQKAVTDEIAQLAGDVEQLAYVKIKNEAVNGNFENGLIAPFYHSEGNGTSTLDINSSTPISGNYDIRFTITTPTTMSGRPIFFGLNRAGNIGDKIYLHFDAKILSGVPKIHSIHNGESDLTIYEGDVINGRNTRIIDVEGTGGNLGTIYFSSGSVWDVQMDNFMRINLTETFGAGNEPTKEEMDLLISTLGIDYFEGEITIPAQKVRQLQLAVDLNKYLTSDTDGTIKKGDVKINPKTTTDMVVSGGSLGGSNTLTDILLSTVYVNTDVIEDTFFTLIGYITQAGGVRLFPDAVSRVTPFIHIPVNAVKVSYTYVYNTENGLMVFYDSSKRQVGVITEYEEEGEDVEFSIPSNAEYVRIAGRDNRAFSFIDSDEKKIKTSLPIHLPTLIFEVNDKLVEYSDVYHLNNLLLSYTGDVYESAFTTRAYIDIFGKVTDSDSGVLVTDFLEIPDDVDIIKYSYSYNNGVAIMVFYDENKESIEIITDYEEIGDEVVFNIPDGTKFVRLAGRGHEHPDYSKPLKASTAIKNKYEITESAFTTRAYFSSAGRVANSDSGVLVSEFISIPESAKRIKYSYSYNNGVAIMVFYDENKESIEIITDYEEIGDEVVFNIPDGTKFVRLAGRGHEHPDYSKELSAYIVDSSNENLELEETYSSSDSIGLFVRKVNIPMLINEAVMAISSEGGGGENITFLNSKVDTEWEGWEERRFTFGLDKNRVPVPVQANTQMIADGTVICKGESRKLRWGYHVFEAYALDKASRITLLLNKHVEEGLPVAELYYYGTAYSHHQKAYNWFRIGSDVKDHSFLFGRDHAISFGSHDFRSVIELAAIDVSTDIDDTYSTIEAADIAFEPENRSLENAKCMLYFALRDASNGAMFYDKVRHKIVAKVDGKWNDVQVNEVPEGTYSF